MASRQDEPATDCEDAEAVYARVLTEFAEELNDLHSRHDAPSLQRLVDRSAEGRGRPLAKSTISEALNGKRLPSIDITLRLVQLLAADAPAAAREKLAAHWRARWQAAKRLQKAARRQARSRTDSAPAALPVQRTVQNGAEHSGTSSHEPELCSELPFSPPFYFFLDGYADVWSVFDRCDMNTTPLTERTWYRVVGHGPDNGWIITTAPPDPPVVLGLLLTPGKIRREHIRKYLPA
ncbi:hypothetical protein [Streptomyces sp. NBC_00829]|uniref:hypothetical protein n=1 Tax=Streptomyces sp. NBC_00829 TaxID=2903679 RepID=UPI0038647521|nr:hypothetical protein OG293_11925 [Streptomyces sp. NBC_00829]